MLQQPLSETEDALRDTVVGKSAGFALVDLGNLYDMPYPKSLSEDAWREAMRVAVFGPRGTPGVTLPFLEAALGDFKTTVEVTIDPAFPQRLTAVTSGSFVQEHIGRWVRVKGLLHLIEGPDTIGSGDLVELASLGTSSWTGADFSGLSAPETVDADILAFTVREPTPGPIPNPTASQPDSTGGTPGLVQILLHSNLAFVPPTYIIETSGAARPAGQPYGGHIQDDEFEPSSQVTGPYPLYLVGVAFPEVQRVLDLLLVSGNRAEFSDASLNG